MEFFFTGFFAPNIGESVQINAVQLLEDDVKVAAAEYTSVFSTLARDFSLFYKTKVGPGEDHDYKIQFITDVGTDGATIEIESLQFSWGYRTYTGDYSLELVTPPTCP